MKLIFALVEKSKRNGVRLRNPSGNIVDPNELPYPYAVTLNEEGWSVVEPPTPPKARMRIVPTKIDVAGRYWIQGLGVYLDAVMGFSQWTGRVEVTFADGTKKVYLFKDAFAMGSAGSTNGQTLTDSNMHYFIPAKITGVEFWEA